MKLLKKKKTSFNVTDISTNRIQELCINSIGADWVEIGELRKAIQDVFQGKMNLEELRLLLVKVFYKVGIIGIKPNPSARTIWTFLEREMLREAEITESSRLEICPMFFRILGTDTR